MKWKPVELNPRYEVSDTGLVRKANGDEIGQCANDQGYLLVRFARPRSMQRVHRLVAAAFVDNPRQLPFVNHIDCNPANNHAGNLEWCTQRENINHSDRLGRTQRDYWKGKRSPSAILSDETVREIRSIYAKGGVSWERLGKQFGVSKRTVGRIVRMETYV